MSGGRPAPRVTMPRRARATVAVLLVLTALWASGCATMRGMGEDLQSLGRGIKQVFTP